MMDFAQNVFGLVLRQELEEKATRLRTTHSMKFFRPSQIF